MDIYASGSFMSSTFLHFNLLVTYKAFAMYMFRFSLRMKQKTWVAKVCKITDTAQEMPEFFWHPKFHHKNFVMSILIRTFYTAHSIFRLRLAVSNRNYILTINLKHEIQVGKLQLCSLFCFLEKLYIVFHVQFKIRDKGQADAIFRISYNESHNLADHRTVRC